MRQDIKVAVKLTDDGVRGAVQVKGPHAFIGRFLEYGTAPHYISVDDSQRGGRSAARVNRLARQGVLVINGQPVGKTVLHPGARPHPFLRPALDLKEDEARVAAQAYVRTKLRLGDSGSEPGPSGD